MALLPEYAAEHAVRTPDKEAVTDGVRRLTYRELDTLANRVAGWLRAHGVARGELVLVAMKRSPEYIAAVIGVMRVGAAYVPLEGRTPAKRRAQIAADCRPRAVLCDGELAAALQTDEQLRALEVAVGIVDERLPACESIARAAAASDDELATVIYTSGSTGTPKGVMLTHRNIDAYVAWAVERIGIAADDRVLGTAPFYFDMSLFDIYGSLRAGATLCIATERVLLFPAQLVELAERERVTVWKGVSSLLAYLARVGALAPGKLSTLRSVLFGGEPLPTRFLIEWMRALPHATFFNAYGPTEATGVSMYYRVERCPEDAGEKIPLGIPCENVDLLLLDEARRPVARGEIGEIALGGECIARGYLNDPVRTERVFVADHTRPGTDARIYLTGDFARQRSDDNYEFLGRKDHQVKVMGYRVELTDVENALVAVDGVHGAGALVVEALTGTGELVAYVETADGIELPLVQAELKRRLPFYMLPRHLYRIAQLPRSDRGKLDRRELEAIHRMRATS